MVPSTRSCCFKIILMGSFSMHTRRNNAYHKIAIAGIIHQSIPMTLRILEKDKVNIQSIGLVPTFMSGFGQKIMCKNEIREVS